MSSSLEGASRQSDNHCRTLFPAAPAGTEPFLTWPRSPACSQMVQIGAGPRLLSMLVGLGAALGVQNHQAVVN